MIINLIKGEDFTTTGTQTYALKTRFLIRRLLLNLFQPNSSNKTQVISNLDDEERFGKKNRKKPVCVLSGKVFLISY